MNCATRVDVKMGDPEDPYVISSTCESVGVQWTQLVLPEWTLRMGWAPPSNFVAGNVLLSAVEDSGDVAMVVALEAETADALTALMAEVKAALIVWPGEFSVISVDDNDVETVVAGPWQSFPTVPRWGEITALLHGTYYIDGSFSITVNPAGAP